jgi:hypothetical protein
MKPIYDDEGRVKHYEMDGPFDFIQVWVMEVVTCIERMFGGVQGQHPNGPSFGSPEARHRPSHHETVSGSGSEVVRHYGDGPSTRNFGGDEHPLLDSYDPDWGVSFESYCDSQDKSD